MRIFAANPDGMGDLILRQPLYAALRAAGHELMLSIRRPWMELAAELFPKAQLVPIESDPYLLGLHPDYSAFENVAEAAAKFSPDTFLVAPFQWTLLEEWLAEKSPGTCIAGMRGYLFKGDPLWGTVVQSKMRFDLEATIAETTRELDKNELLASLLLKRKVHLPRPKLAVPKETLAEARKKLDQLGLHSGKYWIANVGHGLHKEVRNWRPQNWTALIEYWVKKYERRFLLIGDPDERDVCEEIRSSMGGESASSVVIHCQRSSLTTLAGLCHLSRGYLGKDTGPMHLAAAVGKPVIAVFGGGTWPRFIPAVEPSWVAMMNVSCAPCDWRCPFDESYCVKEVPLKEVCGAVDQIESGKLRTAVVRQLTAPAKLQSLMIHQVRHAVNRADFESAQNRRAELASREATWSQRFLAQQSDLETQREALSQTGRHFEETQIQFAQMRIQLAEQAAQIQGQATQVDDQVARMGEQTSRIEQQASELSQQKRRIEQQAEEIAGQSAQLAAALRERQSRPDAMNPAPWPSAPRSATLPPTLPGGKPWPKISVVTPTRNQGKYIEQTIQSVLNQNYPNLEYIIMDGGSTDETLSIIDRYRDRISIVVSEKDRGQSHAINKGFALASGDLFTWLNSDDMFEPGALAAMAVAFHTSDADIVAGICSLYSGGKLIHRHLTACVNGPLPLEEVLDLEGCHQRGQFFYQPEVMFTRDLWLRAGGYVDESLYCVMDFDLWVRFAEQGAKLHSIGRSICRFRVHEEQKTADPEFQNEAITVRDRHLQRLGMSLNRKPAVLSRESLRIVFFNDLGNSHGAGIAHHRLAAACAMAGHEIIPVAIYSNLIRCQMSNEQILLAIASHNPDLVVMGNIHAVQLDPGLLGMIAQRWPTVQVLHDLYSLTGRCPHTGGCMKYLSGCDFTCPTAHQYPALEPSQIHLAWEKKHRAMISEDSPILAGNSAWTARFARHRFDDAAPGLVPANRKPRVIELRLGLPLDVFKPRDKKMCRELLGIPHDRFIILFSSSQLGDKLKGLSLLTESIEKLKLKDVLVICLGHYGVDLDVKGVEFRAMGYMADPHSVAMLYSAADLYVGPSQVETFGQVFVEAAACGTPAIGFATAGGVPEAVCDQLSGRLAENVGVDDLAEMISVLHDDPKLRAQMSVWGRIWIENEFSYHSAYQRFFAELNRLGVTRKLNLAPRVTFYHDDAAVPETKYLVSLEEPAPVKEPAPSGNGHAAFAQMQSRVASLEAERDSLRSSMQSMTHTRLWRMVAVAYPVYQRVLGNARIPRLARRGIQTIGQWLSDRPQNGKPQNGKH